jgi:uncharacterized membrane protein
MSNLFLYLHYLAGALVLALGLTTVRKELAEKRVLDKLVALGPTLFAVPLAIFGVEHFAFAKIIAGMVPPWIPAHMFWAIFVGVCLIAAALSIAGRMMSGIAGLLLAVMLVLFVALLHIPGIAAGPHDRFIWAVGLRDLAFAGGALSLATWNPQYRHTAVTLARLVIAVAVIFFAVEQFLHPQFAPGVPLQMATPGWIPAHSLWGYLIGAVYAVTGVSLLINKHAYLAAAWLGTTVLLIVLFIYVPILVSNPRDIGTGMNYFADTLLFGGGALCLALGISLDSPGQAAVETLGSFAELQSPYPR